MTTQPHTSTSIQTYAQQLLQSRAKTLRILLGGQPRRLSKMARPGSSSKYFDIKEELTLTLLQQHIAGDITLAATLDIDGTAQEGAADIDAGGRDGLVAALVRCHRAGLPALAIAMTTEGGHSGGHIRILYNARYPSADIRAQLVGMLGDLTTEIWPDYDQPLRVWFGYHKLAQSYGELIWIDDAGEVRSLNLDDADQRDDGWRVVLTMRRATRPPEALKRLIEQAVPFKPTLNTTKRRYTGAKRLDGPAAIKQFNAEHPMDSLLESYGATAVRGGYDCPCGANHGPGVKISVSSTHPHRARSFSDNPACKFSKTNYPNGFDSFNLFTDMDHHGDRVEALKEWNPPPEPKQRTKAPEAPTPTEIPPQVDPGRLEARRADAARKREARKQEAIEVRATVEMHAAQNEQLAQTPQIVLAVLLDIAGDRDWCRPSIAAIKQKMTGLGFTRRPPSDSTIRRAIHDLEKAGYLLKSEARGGSSQCTAIRTFLRQDVSTLVTLNNESIDIACTNPKEEPVSAPPEATPELEYGMLQLKERWSMRPEYERLKREQFVYQPDAGDLVEQEAIFEEPKTTKIVDLPSHLDSDPRIAAERSKMANWDENALIIAKIKCERTLKKYAGRSWVAKERYKLRAINELLNALAEAEFPSIYGDQVEETGQIDQLESDVEIPYLAICDSDQHHSLGGAHKLPAEGGPPVGRVYDREYANDMIARLQADKQQREAPANVRFVSGFELQRDGIDRAAVPSAENRADISLAMAAAV